MPVDQNAALRITAFEWVPRFARGFVRDLRPRWACEELGLPYATRLISATERPDWYFREQPWGQVPVLEDDALTLFESGAILLHLGERDTRLLPRDREGRARVLCWLFAAFNSIEPVFMEIANVEIFCRDEPWAVLRRPGLLAEAGQRLDRLEAALDDRDWLAGASASPTSPWSRCCAKWATPACSTIDRRWPRTCSAASRVRRSPPRCTRN